MTRVPHFIRVARAIALISTATSAGCASMVVPYDPDADYADASAPSDGSTAADHADTGLLANGCQRSRPYTYGGQCEPEGLVCDPDPCGGLVCRSVRAGDPPTWRPNNICNGPLSPPEEAQRV